MDLQETKNKVTQKKCVVEIFGVGYVGFPLGIRLASYGFNVVDIDTNEERLKRLESNQLKQSENNLKEQFIDVRNKKKLSFSKLSSESSLPRIGIICVPTPISHKQNDSNIFVNTAIENFLSFSKKGDVLIIESSLQVGTFEKIQSIIKKRGFSIGDDFGLAYCPERIDPLNKKWDLHNIPRIIYCKEDATFEIAKLIYQNINQANLVRVTSSKVAEIVKSFENTFRLVNISLVNELAILCDRLDIDISEVMSAASTKPFGFIPFYSGAGAGGHCIPKDSMSLYNSAKEIDFDFSIVKRALEINELVPKYIVESVEKILTEKHLSLQVALSVIISSAIYIISVQWSGIPTSHSVALGIILPLAAGIGHFTLQKFEKDLGIRSVRLQPGRGKYIKAAGLYLFTAPIAFHYLRWFLKWGDL